MEASLVALLAAAVGLGAGAFFAWFAMRQAAAGAYERGKGEISVELATVRERVRTLEEEKASHEVFKREAAAWRDQLEEAGRDRARLSERASLIPGMEEKAAKTDRALAEALAQVVELREANGRIEAELAAAKGAAVKLGGELESEKSRREAVDAELSDLRSRSAALAKELEGERSQAAEKIQLLSEARQSLVDQFKALAGEILEEKSKRFTEQNQTNLGQLLDPLKAKLAEFQTKVETVYDNETRDRTSLKVQVQQLFELNQTLSQDAKNLTRALTTSGKTQGDWGQLVLERVLEKAGLRKGEEFEIQVSHTREDGSRVQPDVVIHLPEERHLVIDAKASLVAFQEFDTAEDDAGRQEALRRHLQSIRTHMNGLAAKNYHTLYGLKSLDFVIMFVPIEPAFLLAVTNDRDLFADAWQRNVILVSPSTLLFVVRTVAHLWRQEAQGRNAQDIARRGAELYDRLVGFVEDLEKVGERLQQAQDSFVAARDKLSKNRGNVIRQAEMLRQLGVKPSKTLPQKLSESAADGEVAAAPALPAA